MNNTSEPGSESSLPSHTLSALPSSPPMLNLLPNTENMDNGSENESEPHQTQDAQPVLKRVNSDETERPPSAQQTQHASDGQASETSDEEFDSEDSDPAHRIEDFDWEDLHHRYHEAMKVCHGEEAALMEEWEDLMLYFRIWAQSGHEHETDRTYSRLCTRTAYVQHSEDALEQKRNHYVSVVKAFESALSLLKASGLGR
ncbi:hypothetical protein yc1106_04526 [Curvularia clavata]|uniref:Uncharacterized protein n=1 Tax=Curvularia clavata TaxID=95742 RepID=A0A9Q8Z7Y3_CURCL|nr:hypothetical protein yc1106_04526 [Curvularia clavata]